MTHTGSQPQPAPVSSLAWRATRRRVGTTGVQLGLLMACLPVLTAVVGCGGGKQESVEPQAKVADLTRQRVETIEAFVNTGQLPRPYLDEAVVLFKAQTLDGRLQKRREIYEQLGDGEVQASTAILALKSLANETAASPRSAEPSPESARTTQTSARAPSSASAPPPQAQPAPAPVAPARADAPPAPTARPANSSVTAGSTSGTRPPQTTAQPAPTPAPRYTASSIDPSKGDRPGAGTGQVPTGGTSAAAGGAASAAIIPVTQRTALMRLAAAPESERFAVVEGEVEFVAPAPRVANIYFKGVTKEDLGFHLVYFPSLFAQMDQAFGKDSANLVGKRIRVSGPVGVYRDRPQIKVEKVEQITILE